MVSNETETPIQNHSPLALAVEAARMARQVREAARDQAWERGLAEAVAALQDFAVIVMPAVVSCVDDMGAQVRETNIEAARAGRVSICIDVPPGRKWLRRRVVTVVWEAEKGGRWHYIGEPPASAIGRVELQNRCDGTLAGILLHAVREPDFADDLAAVTSSPQVFASPVVQACEVDTPPIASPSRGVLRDNWVLITWLAALVLTTIACVIGIIVG